MIESPSSPAAAAGIDNGACACNVHVLNELGLHARPAAVLAQEAQKFRAEIQLRTEDQEVDAKSILDILSLAASRGSELELHATGADAREAVDRLSHCFRTRFGEEK
ncbi:HPr family phosphocarrier protein [Megalodesulfovibrio gigas]|nr:HPr family phosphocarrier protein [Megalodesulfovibrio gigas]